MAFFKKSIKHHLTTLFYTRVSQFYRQDLTRSSGIQKIMEIWFDHIPERRKQNAYYNTPYRPH